MDNGGFGWIGLDSDIPRSIPTDSNFSFGLQCIAMDTCASGTRLIQMQISADGFLQMDSYKFRFNFLMWARSEHLKLVTRHIPTDF